MNSYEQKMAAAPSSGAVLILAGAGSGKTRTIVSRIRNTINEGLCTADECLIMTFSTRAAHEIKERCGDSRIVAGTFHSVALSILTEFSARTADTIHKYHALGETEREALIRMIFSEMKESFLGVPLDCVISILKLDNKHRQNILSKIPEDLVLPFITIQQRILAVKQKRNLIDYDDMISAASDLIDSDETVRNTVRKRFKYIFVDEYQDISEDLFHFFTRITGVNGNICATGDDAQSIYGFRSADINYIVRFRKYFPSASVFMLTRNYRSRREIVDLASLCISRNRNRIRKKIISAAGSGGTISWHQYHSESAQYLQVLDIIDNTSIDGRSIAVLFRNNYQGEILRKYASQAGNNKLSGVELLTIHGSKGLEYDTVILLGVEDGIFPSELSEIEEERRLFYVAITRAKEKLHILYHSTEKGTARFAKETFLSTRWTAHRCISRTRSAIAFNRKPINRDQNHP